MYDIVIIGMGITGCYLSYLLNQRYPYKKILCLEKTLRYGGRILSVEWERQIVDLGAWRYSPSTHTYVQNLVDMYKIETLPIPVQDRDTSPLSALISDAPEIDTGVISYLYEMGISDDQIDQYIEQSGYNIFADDITLDLMVRESKIEDPFRYMKYGYITLCDHLIASMNDNVHIQLGQRVISVSDGVITTDQSSVQYHTGNLYVTVQPNALAEIIPTSILSSMVGYDALRAYIQIDKIIPFGLYVSSLPPRKIYVYRTGYAMIYTDGSDARVLESVLRTKRSLLDQWISMIVGQEIHISSVIYKYWNDGIFFWRPGRDRSIDTPFIYLNGDVSQEPGWVNGSLSLVQETLRLSL